MNNTLLFMHLYSMNLPFFIVKKIAFNQHQSFSRFIIKISIIAVALSMTVMIVATALISGFQQTISQKVFGFWAHVIVTPYKSADSLDKFSVSTDIDLYQNYENYEGIEHIQSVALKGGIIHTKEDYEGIVLKGIGKDFKADAFTNYIQEGQLFEVTQKKNNQGILISQKTADRLLLAVGDKLLVSFFEDNAKVRKRSFIVSGIYNSGIEEFDKQYALIDIGVIQDLNNWKEDEVGGFEIFVDDNHLFDSKLKTYAKKIMAIFLPRSKGIALQQTPLDQFGEEIKHQIDLNLTAQTIKDFKPDIFNWLSLQNTNEIVILFVMLIVAAVNMITSLLILILERTSMIGILKSLGMNNAKLQELFIYNGAIILGVGMLIGNILGISICILQDSTHLIRLPQDSYYIDYAPILIEWSWIFFINIFTLIIGVLFLLLPARLVQSIEPIKAIKFS